MTARVLAVEDTPSLRDLLQLCLARAGYRVDLAEVGETAVAMFAAAPYDAVVMDLTIIGGMGGEDCFRELKKLDPEVRAIVSSGYDNDEMAQRYLDMGFCGYLTKPYRVTDLGRVIKTVVG